MEIKVKTKIHPSEDEEKVIKCVKHIFPSLDYEIKNRRLLGKSNEPESLETFKNKIGLQAIRDSARRGMKKGIEDDKIRFFLNKQAATVHKVSFSDGETPLGPIEVVLETKDVDKLINYLAPSKDER